MNSTRGSVGRGQMSITRDIGNLDEQLANLREAVKKEREKRGGGRVWKSSERAVNGGVAVRRTSVLSGRLPKKEVVGCFEERPQSAEVTDTLQRIREFDLFTGEFNGADSVHPARDVTEIQKAKEAYMRDFEEIENYKYDEDEEAKRFHASKQQSILTPTKIKKPAKLPSPPPDRHGRPHRGGIWSAYDVDTKSGAALSTWSGKKTTTQQQHPSAVRISELQNILLAPPPGDSDTTEHQRRQQLALKELQRLQNGEEQEEKPKWSYKEKENRGEEQSGSGGMLLQGTYNEAENRKQFEDAVKMWRGGGGEEKTLQSRRETTNAAIGDNSPVIKPLAEGFIAELDSASEYVYFNHLLECGSV